MYCRFSGQSILPATGDLPCWSSLTVANSTASASVGGIMMDLADLQPSETSDQGVAERDRIGTSMWRHAN